MSDSVGRHASTDLAGIVERAEQSYQQPQPARHTVTVPGLSRTVGLGDIVKAATAAVGIRACGGCARRAETLNTYVAFQGRRRR